MHGEPFGRCPVCGERIGAYEPLVLLLPGGIVLHGGLTALREHVAQGLLQHRTCFEQTVSQA